jgi:pyrrolidone-carboxylate peptidase
VPLEILLAGFAATDLARPAAGLSGTRTTTRLLDACEASERAEGEGFARGVRITVLRLPPRYADLPTVLTAALRDDVYDDLLVLGTDPGSSDHKLHVLAANYADHGEPDADGTILQDHIIDAAGPVAYRSRLPLDGIWDKFLVERVPVRMSHKATLGLYNHAIYTALHIIDTNGLHTRCGALETPPLPADAAEGVAPRSLDELTEDLLMVVSVLAQLHPAGSTGTPEGTRTGTVRGT